MLVALIVAVGIGAVAAALTVVATGQRAEETRDEAVTRGLAVAAPVAGSCEADPAETRALLGEGACAAAADVQALPAIVAAQNGRDGVDGRDGDDGGAGRDGLDGEDGRDGADGQSPACLAEPAACQGADGRDGVDGRDGLDGEDGADAEPVPPADRYTLRQTDGRTFDCVRVPDVLPPVYDCTEIPTAEPATTEPEPSLDNALLTFND